MKEDPLADSDSSTRLEALIKSEQQITSLVNYYAQNPNYNELAALPDYDLSMGVTRRGLSWEEEEMMRDIEKRAKEDGLGVFQDPYGNRYLYIKGRDIEKGKSVEIHMGGSHIDSVPWGGRFDGPAGGFAVYLALKRLKGLEVQPEHTVVALFLKNEESGGGFGGKPYGGAQALAGTLIEADLQAQNDEGKTRRECLQTLARDPQQILEKSGFSGFLEHLGVAPERVAKVSMIEPHIEQADNLVEYRQKYLIEEPLIGIVETVCSPARTKLTFSPRKDERGDKKEFTLREDFYTFEIKGQRAHSGTTPMSKRADSLVGFAKLVKDIQEINISFKGKGRVVSRDLREAAEAGFAMTAVAGEAFVDIEIQANDKGTSGEILAQLKEKVAGLEKSASVSCILDKTPEQVEDGLKGKKSIDENVVFAVAETILKIKDIFTEIDEETGIVQVAEPEQEAKIFGVTQQRKDVHGLRGTIGIVRVNPDGSLTLYQDIRIAQPGYILSIHGRLADFVWKLKNKYPINLDARSLTDVWKHNPVILNKELQALAEEASEKVRVVSHRMPSWAGHDTAYLVQTGIKVSERVIPVDGEILFSPSTGGSHNSNENAEERDLEAVSQVSTWMLYSLGKYH